MDQPFNLKLVVPGWGLTEGQVTGMKNQRGIKTRQDG